MDLIQKHYVGHGSKKERVFDIAGAVEYQNTPGPWDRRERADEARDVADNAISLLGRLMKVLHDKGLLDDGEVIDLIGKHAWTTEERETFLRDVPTDDGEPGE